MVNKANARDGAYTQPYGLGYYTPRALRDAVDSGAYAKAMPDQYSFGSGDDRSLLNFDERRWWKKKFIWIGLAILLLVLILAAIGITLGITLSKKVDKSTTTEKPNVAPPRMTFAFNIAHYTPSRSKRASSSSSEDRSRTFDVIAEVMADYAETEMEFGFYAVASKGRSKHSDYFTFNTALEILREWSAMSEESNPDLAGALASAHESMDDLSEDFSYVLFPPLPEDYSSIDIFDADMKASKSEAKELFERITASIIVTGKETIDYFVDVGDDVRIVSADGLNSSQIADNIASNIPAFSTSKSTTVMSTLIPNTSATTTGAATASQTNSALTTIFRTTTRAEPSTSEAETTMLTSLHTVAPSTSISQQVSNTATSPWTTAAAVTTTQSAGNVTLLTSVSDLITAEATTTSETQASPLTQNTSASPPTSVNGSTESTSPARPESTTSSSPAVTATSKLTTLPTSSANAVLSTTAVQSTPSVPVATTSFTTISSTDAPTTASTTTMIQYNASTSTTTATTTSTATQEWTTAPASILTTGEERTTTPSSSSEKPETSSVGTATVSSTDLPTTTETSPLTTTPSTTLTMSTTTSTADTPYYPQCDIAANNIFMSMIFDISETAQSSITTWQASITMNIARDQLQLSENGPTRMCINGVASNATDNAIIDKTPEEVENHINYLSTNAHLYQHNSEFNVGKALRRYSENFGGDNPTDSIAIIIIYATSNITDVNDAIHIATSIRQSGQYILVVANSGTLMEQAAKIAGDQTHVEIMGDSTASIITWFHNKVCIFVSQWASRATSTWTTTSATLLTTTVSAFPPTTAQTAAPSGTSSSQIPTTHTQQIITTPESSSPTMTTTSPMVTTTGTTVAKTTTDSSPKCNVSANSVYASVIFDITEFGLETIKTWQREITMAIAKEQLDLRLDGQTRMSINGVAYNATHTSTFVKSLTKVEDHINILFATAPKYEYNNEFNVDKALQEYLEMFGGSTPSNIIPIVMVYANSTFTDIPQAKHTADKLRELGHHLLIVAANTKIKDAISSVADDKSMVAVFISDVHSIVTWFQEETCKIIWNGKSTASSTIEATSPTTMAAIATPSAQHTTSTVIPLTSIVDATTTTTTAATAAATTTTEATTTAATTAAATTTTEATTTGATTTAATTTAAAATTTAATTAAATTMTGATTTTATTTTPTTTVAATTTAEATTTEATTTATTTAAATTVTGATTTAATTKEATTTTTTAATTTTPATTAATTTAATQTQPTTTTQSSTSTVTTARPLSSTLATTTQRPSTTTTSYIHRPCDVSANKIYVSIFLDITIFGAGQAIQWQTDVAIAIAKKLNLGGGCTGVSVNGFADTTTANITFESTLSAVQNDIDYIWRIAYDYQGDYEFNAATALETYQKGVVENLPSNAIPVIIMFATQAFSDVTNAVTVANSLRSDGRHVLILAADEYSRRANVMVADDDSSTIIYGSSAAAVVEWFDEKACKFVNTAPPNIGHC